MRIDLIGTGCPVLAGVRADGQDARWTLLDVRLAAGPDLRGPAIHGRPGARFLYLSWSREGEGVFRRAKLMLDAVPPDVLAAAEHTGLTARFTLAMPDGSPVCAALRPPRIAWSAS